ncbi:MAG: GtrA family protein [Lachnospiraceae bacterium]|jgi:putative flippase GtrA|nr:GtrA family protein [Lachnospiraceae bacterium]
MSEQQNNKFQKYLSKLANRETITYLMAGVLTTVVNFIAYYLFCNVMKIENLIANVIAWILAVAFAYIINNSWVFQSQKQNRKKELDKIMKFIGARVFSLIIEEIGLWIMVDHLHWNNMLVKAFLAVFVVAINYVFSKLYIFNK